MFIRSISAAMLGAMLLSAPALAGDHDIRYRAENMPYQGPTAQVLKAKCTSLQTQFDKMIGQHETAAMANEAKAMRAYAGNLCRQGKSADGVAQLKLAIQNIGVKVEN